MSDFIEIHDNALPAAFCSQIIERFEQSPHPHPGRTGGGVDPERKDSLDLTITDHPDWQDINHQIVETTLRYVTGYFDRHHFALIGAFGLQVPHPQTGEPVTLDHDTYQQVGAQVAGDLVRTLYRPGAINVQRYDQGKGGYPHWHSEIFPKDQSCEQLHRVLLWMYYLNDVEQGGQTEFFYQNKSIEPRVGRMVIAPGGFTHTHRGLVPQSSDKYILTSWILFKRAEAIYGS